MRGEIVLVIILIIMLMIPPALSPNPLPYIIGFLLWGSIMYLLEKNQVGENGKSGDT